MCAVFVKCAVSRERLLLKVLMEAEGSLNWEILNL